MSHEGLSQWLRGQVCVCAAAAAAAGSSTRQQQRRSDHVASMQHIAYESTYGKCSSGSARALSAMPLRGVLFFKSFKSAKRKSAQVASPQKSGGTSGSCWQLWSSLRDSSCAWRTWKITALLLVSLYSFFGFPLFSLSLFSFLFLFSHGIFHVSSVCCSCSCCCCSCSTSSAPAACSTKISKPNQQP
jgi:hypothetical protein